MLWPILVWAAVTLRDGVGLDDIGAAAALCAAVMTICGFVWWATKPARVAAEHWTRFWDDWHGAPATPGRDPVPGVMQRLARIDGEFQRNGGNSLKDLAHSTSRKLDALAAQKEAEHAAIRAEIESVKRTIESKEEC